MAKTSASSRWYRSNEFEPIKTAFCGVGIGVSGGVNLLSKRVCDNVGVYCDISDRPIMAACKVIRILTFLLMMTTAHAQPEEGDVVLIDETGEYQIVDEVLPDGTVYVYGEDTEFNEDEYQEDD